MRMKNNDGTYLELKITPSYKPNITINYDLVKLSNSGYHSIDRGALTDRYSSTMTFRDTPEYIRELVSELTLLRDNNKSVLIDEFEENVFGDNVDYSGVIDCVVEKIDKETSPVFNVQTITITFLATDLSFIDNPIIPPLNCMNNDWAGYSEWNTHVNETYTRQNYFIDRVADTYIFEGEYILSIEDNASLLSFWKTQRGSSFDINDGDFGTEFMFGPVAGNGTHKVIILDISYNRLSPIYRTTTIQLVKVG